jgi:hypothetical protein
MHCAHCLDATAYSDSSLTSAVVHVATDLPTKVIRPSVTSATSVSLHGINVMRMIDASSDLSPSQSSDYFQAVNQFVHFNILFIHSNV